MFVRIDRYTRHSLAASLSIAGLYGTAVATQDSGLSGSDINWFAPAFDSLLALLVPIGLYNAFKSPTATSRIVSLACSIIAASLVMHLVYVLFLDVDRPMIPDDLPDEELYQ